LNVQPPLVAIPTTSGSGAEATHFAVMYEGGVKQSVADASMRPDFTILDPALTDALPPDITASTGFDALSQAIESAWSIRSTEETLSMSFEAITLAARNLVPSVVDPSPGNRDAMMRAAHLAGVAIDTTFTTAPHAMSYKLTSTFGVRHGHAVALTLGQVIEYNAAVTDSDCVDPRGSDHVRDTVDAICQLLDANSPAEASQRIRSMLRQTALADSLAAVGVSTEESLLTIADSVNTERLANNPRALDHSSIMNILRRIN
jgi:alcohol dehydrogenase class IV